MLAVRVWAGRAEPTDPAPSGLLLPPCGGGPALSFTHHPSPGPHTHLLFCCPPNLASLGLVGLVGLVGLPGGLRIWGKEWDSEQWRGRLVDSAGVLRTGRLTSGPLGASPGQDERQEKSEASRSPSSRETSLSLWGATSTMGEADPIHTPPRYRPSQGRGGL